MEQTNSSGTNLGPDTDNSQGFRGYCQSLQASSGM